MTSFVLMTEDNQAVYLVQLLNALNDPEEAKRQEKAVRDAHNAPINEQAVKIEQLEAKEINIAHQSPLGKFVVREQYYELITQGFFPSIENIMNAKPSQIDTAFTLVFSLLPKIASTAGSIQNIINKLAQVLSTDHQSHPALKLRLFAILFNLLGPGSLIRHDILIKIFDLALSSRRPKLPLTFVKPLDEWVKVWSRSPHFDAEKVAITYFKVSQLAEAAKDSKKRYHYMYKYVKAIGEAQQLSDDHKAHVATAIIEVLKVAGGPQSKTIIADCGRLVEMAAVKALQTVPKYKKLIKLLKIFAYEPIREYVDFQKENAQMISELGLNHTDCMSRMRTLTLCDLGMIHETLTFKQIEEKLLIGTETSIDETILNAVMSKLIDARIDEAEKKVIILRTSWRSFRNNDWKMLAEKLGNWKTTLNSVINETFAKRGFSNYR